MNAVLTALVQSLFTASAAEADLPRSLDQERVEPLERHPAYPWLGIEPVATEK